MKIHVPSIPEAGLSVPLSEKDPWVRKLLAERLPDFCGGKTKVRGEIHLLRTNDNVSLHGVLTFPVRLNCDRCARPFETDLEIDITRHLSPFFADPEAREGDEVELIDEDMEFSFYHGEEIDLLDILVEEILLALPMRRYCREDCKGLCPRCGVDLNEQTCSCRDVAEDSPFAALKNLKL
jgi:uncharacterized protein